MSKAAENPFTLNADGSLTISKRMVDLVDVEINRRLEGQKITSPLDYLVVVVEVFHDMTADLKAEALEVVS